MEIKEQLNTFFVECFYSILRAEERYLESITNGKVTLKEIHLIEAVFKGIDSGENNFSAVAKKLKITLGTFTTAFNKLEKKGYLLKEQDTRDKRVFYAVPTRLAEFINLEHTKFHDKLIEGIVNTLNEEEQRNLASALEHLGYFFEELG